ncbi:MAG: LysE family translocator, partial [Thermoplasmata archaeon]|nr:LysE family translocator [Thermoplasmata archaeon]
TLFNPGFILWWLTAGSLIITMALEFGIVVLIAVALLHWSCDFVWGVTISFGIQKAKQFYASKIKDIIRYGCAILILVFGAYFAVTSGIELFG